VKNNIIKTKEQKMNSKETFYGVFLSSSRVFLSGMVVVHLFWIVSMDYLWLCAGGSVWRASRFLYLGPVEMVSLK